MFESDKNLKSTLFSKIPRVKGYLDTLDAYIIAGISRLHVSKKSPGSVVEIGVFFGRSLFFLRTLYREDSVLGIDLFDIGETKEHKAQIEQILDYNDRFDFGLDEGTLFRADSTKISAEDIRARVGQVKLFHIDGGHELNHVVNDAELADEVLSDYGVIVFDDSFSPEWPDVTSGIMHFLNTHPNYRTLCISDKKLYVCKSDMVAEFRTELEKLAVIFESKSTSFVGHQTLILHHPIRKKAISRVLARVGLSGMGLPKLTGPTGVLPTD